MDIHTVQGIFTGIMLVTFLGIVWWAYSKSTKPRFEEAANLPFADDAIDHRSRDEEGRQ